jgi:tRNA (guanine9-N1)-methyltransferase
MNTQLSYCHSVNRKSENPLHLLYSSFNGRLKSRMDNFGKTHENWKGVEWWEEGYEKLWEGFASETAANEEEVEGGVETNAVASSSKILIGHEAGKPRAASIKSDVIYLTGDSPNILTSFEAGKTYILGGIVDHNRYKLLCYDKAVAQGLAHAALPIAEYLPELKTRYILTVNQVGFP